MDTETIQVVDENGKELEFKILFTFDNEDNGKSYVLYYDANEEEPEVYSSIYDEDGNLYPIESQEEWDMIGEVFNSFMAEDHECCCGEDHDHDCCCEHDHECGCHHEG